MDDRDLLKKLLNELEYQLGVGRVTKGPCINIGDEQRHHSARGANQCYLCIKRELDDLLPAPQAEKLYHSYWAFAVNRQESYDLLATKASRMAESAS